MNEHEFDEMLKDTFPQLPPEIIVDKITPCSRAVNQILIGIALCSITLHIFALQYILPSVGMILLLLGFRSLRKENPWFRLCWILALFRTLNLFVILFIHATIYYHAWYASPYYQILMVINPILQFGLLFCFWRGTDAVCKKAELKLPARSAAALMLWYAVILGLTLFEQGGFLLAAALLICLLLLIRSLFHLSAELAETGYVIESAPVRISDRSLVVLLTVLLLAGITSSYLLFGSYPMDWQKADNKPSAQITEIKEHLLALGYPQAALNDLSDEDIQLCKNASCIFVHETDKAILDSATESDAKDLHMTDVIVQLDDSFSHWRIFHHFLWIADPGFHGTEALQIWPAYRGDNPWVRSSGNPTGRVLFNNSNGIYASTLSPLWDAHDISAGFSFPRSSQCQRGYAAYGMEGELNGNWLLDSWMNYVHQQRMLQYPVKTALDSRKNLSVYENDADIFAIIKNAMQFQITANQLNRIR